MRVFFVILLVFSSLGADKFRKGSTFVGISLGSASIANDYYTIAGISGNFFLIDDLSVGFGYEKWFSGNPSLQKVTLESTYYIPFENRIRPYAGVLYRHVFISDSFGDLNSYAYRAGLAFSEKNTVLSAGIVQERYQSARAGVSGTQTYSEVTVSVSF